MSPTAGASGQPDEPGLSPTGQWNQPRLRQTYHLNRYPVVLKLTPNRWEWSHSSRVRLGSSSSQPPSRTVNQPFRLPCASLQTEASSQYLASALFRSTTTAKVLSDGSRGAGNSGSRQSKGQTHTLRLRIAVRTRSLERYPLHSCPDSPPGLCIVRRQIFAP